MFEIGSPQVFWLLLLPFIVRYSLRTVQTASGAGLKVPFYADLVMRLGKTHHKALSFKHNLVFFILWILLVSALADPKWVGGPLASHREGRNIMLILDISGSMALDDMLDNGRPATRLSVVKQAASQFVLQRASDQIGLMLFGAYAYLQTPLTYDHRTLQAQIEDASVGLAGQSTSIGDAIGLAVKRLMHVPKKGRVIILLTDGANNSGMLDPMKAAELARSERIKIYTIGLGARLDPHSLSGMLMRMNGGGDLDEATLQKIAQATKGQYFRATDPKSLQAIYQMINQIEVVKNNTMMIRPQYAYCPWLVGLALCLFFIWLLVQTFNFRLT